MAFQYGISMVPFIRQNMFDVLTTLGLTTNLKLVLDAGDTASYSSGQKWNDRSGGGYDFFRGTDGTSQASDPTFSGIGGAPDSYWSFDAGDYFTYDTTNEAWMENLHKNSANISWAAWIYGRLNGSIFGTAGAAAGANIGVSLRVNASGFQSFRQSGGGSIGTDDATTAVPASGWSYVSGSFNEAGTTLRFNTNGTAETIVSSYTYTGAGSASFTMQVGARGNNDDPIASGKRLAFLSMWEGTALSAANLAAIYTATRTQFGV